jgi:MerR HTH family regulatory protein
MSPRRSPPRATVPVEAAAEPAVELTVVARQASVRTALARRYLAFGLFDPCGGTAEAPLFAPTCAARLAKAERLRRDLGLNYAGAVLVCELLDRITELEDRLVEGSRGDRLLG